MFALRLQPKFFLAGVLSISDSQANFMAYSIIHTSEGLSKTEFTPVSKDRKLGQRRFSQPLNAVHVQETPQLYKIK